MRIVIVESPFAGRGDTEASRHRDRFDNVEFARACIRDCLLRGEAPFASHLLYTQPGVLNDDVPVERDHGIEAGLALATRADVTVVYLDRGMTDGMKRGVASALRHRRPVEYRRLDSRRTA